MPYSPAEEAVSQMSDEDIQAALDALKPNKLDQMIDRLEPKKPAKPVQSADMVRPDYQNDWKWDGNKVRTLTEDEQDAQAEADRIAAKRRAAQLQRAIDQRKRLRTQR
jgi:hypothetical protein